MANLCHNGVTRTIARSWWSEIKKGGTATEENLKFFTYEVGGSAWLTSNPNIRANTCTASGSAKTKRLYLCLYTTGRNDVGTTSLNTTVIAYRNKLPSQVCMPHVSPHIDVNNLRTKGISLRAAYSRAFILSIISLVSCGTKGAMGMATS